MMIRSTFQWRSPSRVATALIGGFLLFNTSCSDFGNSTKPNGTKLEKIQGGGPFPAGSPYLKPNEGDFSVEKMLVNIGVNIVYPASKDLALQSALLVRDLERTCASPAKAQMTSPEWKAAQAQWKEAMLAFHYIEAMSVGPLRRDGFDSHLYAWPTVSHCGIDQMVVATSGGVTPDLSAAAINVKGLAALEFLLFEPSLTASCNKRAYPDVATWAEKPAAEKSADRCGVALALAKDVEANAKLIERQWDPADANFSKVLIDDTLYSSPKAALTDLLHGMYSIEELKDLRLARPLGLAKTCTNDEGICPELAEHDLSGIALEAMAAQVRGFHDAFYGSIDESQKAFSFDDYLEQRGYPEVATRMGSVLYDLGENISAVLGNGKYQDQILAMNVADCKATTLVDRKVELCAIYQDAREITTILKTQILGIFSLEAPPGYQGDND